jgi:hypothetical protein
MYTIQFFSNTTADPSGYGQGQNYLGSISVTTDSTGNVTFTATLSVGAVSGRFISATATDPHGNTSEFAQNFTDSLGAELPAVTSTGLSPANVDQALGSLFLGVINEATLNTLAGVWAKGWPKPTLRKPSQPFPDCDSPLAWKQQRDTPFPVSPNSFVIQCTISRSS